MHNLRDHDSSDAPVEYWPVPIRSNRRVQSHALSHPESGQLIDRNANSSGKVTPAAILHKQDLPLAYVPVREKFINFSRRSSGSGEMADTQVLGTCAPACGFKSRLPHQQVNI